LIFSSAVDTSFIEIFKINYPCPPPWNDVLWNTQNLISAFINTSCWSTSFLNELTFDWAKVDFLKKNNYLSLSIFSKSLKNFTILSQNTCLPYLFKWRPCLVKHILSILSIAKFTWISLLSQFRSVLISLCKNLFISLTFPIHYSLSYRGGSAFTLTQVFF